jgi:histone-lysine N-methyltransferase SETMAR
MVRYQYEPCEMSAASREKVTPCVRVQSGVQKVVVTVFFTSTTLTVSETLPLSRKVNQDYFFSTVLPKLMQEKRQLSRRKRGVPFLIHMDNSACHNGHKITDELTAADIARASHPPYSPDLSPYDFWLFRFLKGSMKSMESSTEDQIVPAITTIWRGVTFDRLQFVFQEWVQRLNWVMENNGEYYFE